MVGKIIFTLAVALSATLVVADITEEDKQAMIATCEHYAKVMEEYYTKTIEKIKAQIDENMSHLDMGDSKEKSCFQKAAEKYEKRLGLAAEEAFEGYAHASMSLKRDIEENRLDQEELKHTQHMLKPNGRYETQISNAIRTVQIEDDQLTKEFARATQKCNKKD